MRTDPIPDRDRLSVCHFCPKATACLTSISRGISLAHAVTGKAPTLAGQVALADCPLGRTCHLDWDSSAGLTRLHRDGRQIMAGHAAHGFDV